MPIIQSNVTKYTIFSLTIALLLVIVLFSAFPKYFLGSLISYRQQSLITPNIDYAGLEEIIDTSIANQISKIKYSGSGYYNITQNDGATYQIFDHRGVEEALLKNKVIRIDFRNPSYTLLYLGNTQHSFGFLRNGLQTIKTGTLLGGGKVHSIISDKWIFIEDCRRDNCPELDK